MRPTMPSLSSWYITPLIAHKRREEESLSGIKIWVFSRFPWTWRTPSWVTVSTCQEPSFGKLFKERKICPNVTSKPGLILLQIMNKNVISSRKIWLLAFVLTPQLPTTDTADLFSALLGLSFGHFPLFNNSVLSLVIPFYQPSSNRITCVIFPHNYMKIFSFNEAVINWER